jgi:hypothetical protein
MDGVFGGYVLYASFLSVLCMQRVNKMTTTRHYIFLFTYPI